MAKEIKIEQLPVYVTLTNKTNAAVKFAPYKENFNTSLGAGESLVLTATTAGQVFYYLKQACADVLEVAIANEKGTATYDVCATESAPATVVITAKEAMAFVPYRENFQFDLEKDDVATFKATTAGQVIYYMNQDVGGKLDVAINTKKVGKN